MEHSEVKNAELAEEGNVEERVLRVIFLLLVEGDAGAEKVLADVNYNRKKI
jgi:hypothetical protein